MRVMYLEAWWELEWLRLRGDEAIAESRRLCAASVRAIDEWRRLQSNAMESTPSN